MRRLARGLPVLLLPAVLAAGCASTAALKKADTDFGRAKAAGAETKAPFEYYAAEAYLGLAHHEKAEGERSRVIVDFSRKSQDYSAEALRKAGGGTK